MALDKDVLALLGTKKEAGVLGHGALGGLLGLLVGHPGMGAVLGGAYGAYKDHSDGQHTHMLKALQEQRQAAPAAPDPGVKQAVEETLALYKLAGPVAPGLMGRILGGAANAARQGGVAAGNWVGRNPEGAMKGLGTAMGAAHHGMIGAGVGAVGGAIQGGEGNRMSGAMKGGLAGGALGGAYGGYKGYQQAKTVLQTPGGQAAAQGLAGAGTYMANRLAR